MSQNPQDASAHILPPKIPTGTQVYDILMKDIEPELLSHLLPGLKERYKDDTPEQAQERKERYAKATESYKPKYEAAMAKLDSALRAYQRNLDSALENSSRNHDETVLSDLESAIASL